MARILNTILFISLAFLLGAASCNKKAIPVKSNVQVTDLSDDLSKYRPKYEAPKDALNSDGQEVIQNEPLVSEYDISEKLNVVLDTVAARNKVLGLLQGYTILVYSGNSRTEADRIRNRLYDIAGGEQVPPLQYVLPTYFVKIGQFHEQIEAQPLYLKIRSYYPDATIVPEKFEAKQ